MANAPHGRSELEAAQEPNAHRRVLTNTEEETVLQTLHDKFWSPGGICPPKALRGIALDVSKKMFQSNRQLTQQFHEQQENNTVYGFERRIATAGELYTRIPLSSS
jgi:hypothetical protein